MKMKLILASALAVSLLSIETGYASLTIAQWTFESSVPTNAGPYSPEIGSGSASGSHVKPSAAYSNPPGNGSGESFSANDWAAGDYWQFAVSTMGYSDITLSWDQYSSGTGPTSFQLAYSTDGLSFTEFGSAYTVAAGSWTSYNNIDLSVITGLDNQATAYIRLINESSVAGSGTDRVDNFTVSGTQSAAAVPEPSTCLAGALVLLPFGVSTFRVLRNRRQPNR